MANNFDLRQFLTENKLTKNAQLLKEEINSNVEDIAGAFHEAGLTGMVTVLFQSDSSMGEPDINTMPAERAMKSIISKAANAESVMVAQGSEIRKGEQIGDYEQETEGLECKVVVEILDKGVYEIYQGSNDLEETSRSMKNKMNEAVTLGGKPVDVGSIEIDDIDTADYPDFTDAYITYAEFEDGTPLTEEELMKLEEENYGIVGELIFDRQLYMEGEEGVEDLEEWSPHGSIAFSGNDKPKQREPREGEVELSTLNKGDVFKVADGKADGKDIEFRVWGDNPNGGVYVQYTDYDFPRPNYTMRGTTKVIKLDGEVSEAKSYKVSKNSKEAQHLKKGDIIGSGEEVVSVSAGAKTPSGKIEVTLKTKDGKTKTSTWGKTTKIGIKEKETVKENTMTERDKYLTRLVENALGLQVTEDDNVDYTMGNQDDPNQLPNPAPELNIPEGDEMVEEKPLPKYENIEKLMQEIDKSTDEEAHKFKMQEMKRVADMLEKKCTALEEGDDADHIDQKKLKQMKKDIMTLRKGIEKMEKLGEKKFTKKETKAELKEGFDLRNFLVENKLTTNSRITEESAE